MVGQLLGSLPDRKSWLHLGGPPLSPDTAGTVDTMELYHSMTVNDLSWITNVVFEGV
jgi:hypothetical protein